MFINSLEKLFTFATHIDGLVVYHTHEFIVNILSRFNLLTYIRILCNLLIKSTYFKDIIKNIFRLIIIFEIHFSKCNMLKYTLYCYII